MNAEQIIGAESWYCPERGDNVRLRGTQETCAATHGCGKRAPIECPLYLHFLLKTSAWHFRLRD